MPWNSLASAIRDRRDRTHARLGLLFAIAVAVAIFLAMLAAAAPPQGESGARLSVYGPQIGYSLSIIEHDGRQYVSVGDLLQQLGEMRVDDNGKKWKAHFNGMELRFEEGKTKAKVRGKDIELPAPFMVDSGRGLVTVGSLALLLTTVLNTHVETHDTARRVFIGDEVTRFSAELNKSSSAVVLNFSAPVNPVVSAEAGKIRMTFTREPLVSGADKQTLEDKTVSYSESNGAAELSVTSGTPLLASFSNGNKTITLAPAPVASPTPAPAPVASAPAAETPAPAAATTPKEAPSTTSVSRGRSLIVIDAAHGGDERGAALSDKLAEKDVTLSFARRLRNELANRGVSVMMVRDGDATLTSDQRAQTTNAGRAAIYVGIHAASLGSGVRVYTSLLPSVDVKPGTLVPWDRAQSSYLDSSHAVAESLAADLTEHKVAVTVQAAPLRPLNNLTAPAVAIELAPAAGEKKTSVESLESPAYQQQMASAIATALVNARKKLEESR
jgi:N-acetylmuramoyl-L-alanine amidase